MRNESELPLDEDQLFERLEFVENSLFAVDSSVSDFHREDGQVRGMHQADPPLPNMSKNQTEHLEIRGLESQDFHDLLNSKAAGTSPRDPSPEIQSVDEVIAADLDDPRLGNNSARPIHEGLAKSDDPSGTRQTARAWNPVPNARNRRQRTERYLVDEQQRASEHFKSAALSRIQALEIELENKNSLIQALTERLEQAAEQLDRLHRTGADRKVVSSSFGASVDRHATLTSDMQRFLDQWDAMQPAVLLGQLDSRLADIRDYLSAQFEQLKSQQAFYLGAGSQLSSLDTAVEQTLDSLLTSNETTHRESASEGNSVLWESLKAQMLSEDKPSDSFAETTSPAGIESLIETDFVEPEVPLPLNLEDCQQQEFETAINQRDAYISWLIRRLRAREISGGPPNWAALEDAPAELVNELRSLQVRLEEHLRLAEVELSLERARCARDLAKVRQQQETLRERPKLSQADDPTPVVHNTKSAERRWRRFLGTPPKE